MTRKKIENQYKEKINLLIKFNKNYYEYSDPIVDDGEYDKLKNEILALEKKYTFLKSENSPSKLVGFKPSKNFKKVFHRVPMLSLSNAFTEEDWLIFEKNFNFLDKKMMQN